MNHLKGCHTQTPLHQCNCWWPKLCLLWNMMDLYSWSDAWNEWIHEVLCMWMHYEIKLDLPPGRYPPETTTGSNLCSSWEEQITTPSPLSLLTLVSCSPDCHPATLTKRERRLAKGVEQRGEGEQNSVCFGRYLLQTYSDHFSACSTHFFHSLLGEYLHQSRLLAHWAYQVQNGWVGKMVNPDLLANMVVTLTHTFCWYN